MKVLSLFDGMACGMLALQGAGVSVDRYVAYEIDKYAVQTSTHNFPMIEHRGDVFEADFKEFQGFDFLMGGSPCTYWSIAQNKNRETEASGLGWELFSQYVRAIREAKPKFFVYENNKSMSKQIRASIDEAFGFEAVCINSSLVSAQNRQRLYWVGRRNEGGTYSKVDIKQPEDLGILLKDVLDGVTDREKGRCVIGSAGRTTTREYFIKRQGTMAFEPVKVGEVGKGGQGNRIYSVDGKSVAQTATSGGIGSNTGLYAIPADKPIYEVKGGKILIKGKQYSIKLADGFYNIRKLTVNECMRLQTVPEEYEFPVSNAQAYKMLGNGWTVEVIKHLILSALADDWML